MICSKNHCTGCYACVNACPMNCIEMIEDELGNVYPQINQDICIHCDLCKKICPSLKDVELKEPMDAYASWNKRDSIRLNSTSGGLATTFSKWILENEGVVYGAGWNHGIVEHLRITNVAALNKIQGSKYTHSHIEYQYQNAKRDLLDNKLVLFIGTPCQIAGLYAYLQKKYDNLYTVDIICHGVPSQKLLREDVSVDFDEVYFRDKEGFNLTGYKNGNILCKKPYYKSLYYQAFLDGVIYRENCYSCRYAQPKRVSDITIGDFWGLGELNSAQKEENKGISVVLPNTEKGKSLLEQVNKDIFIEKRSVEEAVKGNSQLQHPTIRRSATDTFVKLYTDTHDLNKSLKEVLNYDSLINRLKRFVLDSSVLMKIILKIQKK